jgi:hypothetical protein
MKKNLALFIVIIVIVICFACDSGKKDSGSFEVIQAKTSLEAKALNLFDKIKVIPLETTDSSLVGLFISRIVVYDTKIFVLNEMQSHRNILCFDLSGKFLFKLDRIGQGPEEYSHLTNFLIDENLNHLITRCDGIRYMHWDLHGNFLYEIRIDGAYDDYYSIYLNDSTYLALNNATYLTDPKVSLLYLDAATMNIRYASNSVNEYYFNNGGQLLSKNNNTVLYLAHIDTIFDISNINNVYAKYFVFYTDRQVKEKEYMRKNIDKMNDNEQLIFGQKSYREGERISIFGLYETGKYIILGCMRANPDGYHSRNFVLFYDKANKCTYDSKNIDFGGFRINNCSIIGSVNESMYCVLYDEITDKDKKEIKNSKVFSETDKKILLEHKDDDNPLLFILK